MTHLVGSYRGILRSLDQAHRQYGFRYVSASHSVTILNSESRFYASRDNTDHDPMLLLGGNSNVFISD